MSRSLRRFQEQKRKLRKARALYWFHGYDDADYRPSKLIEYWGPQYPWMRIHDPYRVIKLWRPFSRHLMTEAGHSEWKRITMNRPHRARAHRVERAITAGRVEPDTAIFPLWKKPFIYYW